MEALKDLMETIGLNQSFFYHFFLCVTLFFISKKLLFSAYIQAMDQRRQLTKGRLEQTSDLDLKIAKNKELYSKKAKSIHKEFQTVFNVKKEEILTDFSSQSQKLEQEQKEKLNQKRLSMQSKLKEQEKLLKTELSALSEMLLSKIKS